MPPELVQKVTGHKTTDIVLKHYFQPGREDFRQTLQSAMPRLLTNPPSRQGSGGTGGHSPSRKSSGGAGKMPKEEMREMLNEVKPKALLERMLRVWAKW